jgi:hypothetical protein
MAWLRGKEGYFLHNLFSVPAPTPTTSFRGAQAIFRTKRFHVQYPTFSIAVTLHTYSPIKMEQKERSETLAFELQVLGNNPEESIHDIQNAAKIWKSPKLFLLDVLPSIASA